MAALAAIRTNRDLKAFHQRLRDNGKPPKVAITAVMRKLLILANSLIAQNRTWSPTAP
jgi:transposase